MLTPQQKTIVAIMQSSLAVVNKGANLLYGSDEETPNIVGIDQKEQRIFSQIVYLTNLAISDLESICPTLSTSDSSQS